MLFLPRRMEEKRPKVSRGGGMCSSCGSQRPHVWAVICEWQAEVEVGGGHLEKGKALQRCVPLRSLANVRYTATPWKRFSVVSIVYVWPLSPQKDYIHVYISCSFLFLCYGTRFKNEVAWPRNPVSTTSLYPHSLSISCQKRRGREQNCPENLRWCLHINPALGGQGRRTEFKALGRFGLKEMIERKQTGQNSVLLFSNSKQTGELWPGIIK